MILQNRFKEEDKIRIWSDFPFCILSGINENCSLHHIYGTVSDSIFNSIMLCAKVHSLADAQNTAVLGNPFRQKMINKTFWIVTKNTWYKIQRRDVEFLDKFKDDLTPVNKRVAIKIINNYNLSNV